jgi:hypothetical protein
MDSFAQAVETWHDFYMMAGTAAASLLGLLFVGISLNLDAIRRAENESLNVLAAQTLGNFVYVLLFAIILLIPGQDPTGIGLPLFVMGVFGLWNSGRHLRTAVRNRRESGPAYIFWHHVLPTSAFVVLISVSIQVWQGDTHVLYWMIGVIIIFLLIATRNSWDLLVRAHEEPKGRQ